MKLIKHVMASAMGLAFSAVAAPPSIEPFDGARYMFVGASATSNHRWPAYFAAYFALRYPQYTLHFGMDAGSGMNISRMFGNDEFGWDTENTVANHHVHARTVQPYGADFIFIQHAEGGGYAASVDAQHRETYIENYCVPDSIVPIIINGCQGVQPWPSTSESKNEETAINALVTTHEWNSAVIFDTTHDKWGHEYHFTADADTDVITAVGHPFTDEMRVRLSDYGPQGTVFPVPLAKAPSDYYVRDVSGNTFKLALTQGGDPIDLTTNGSATGLSISHKWALINGHDTSHFGVPGYMAIFKYEMDSLGLDTSVSQATINAATRMVTHVNECEISNVAANSYGGVDFKRLDYRLPYVLDDDWWADAVELEPELLTHQDYSMTITGLRAGSYVIFANGVKIGEATAADLAAGWNMAALQVGPVFDKGKEVLGRIRDAQGRERSDHSKNAELPKLSPSQGFEKFKSVAVTSYNVTGNRGAEHASALATEISAMNALNDLIHAAAQPETLHFSIRRRNAGISPAGSSGVPVPPGK